MPVFNSMLNIMPYNCSSCGNGFYAMQHVSEEAKKCGINFAELQASDAIKEPVWNILALMNQIFVNGFGHGSKTTYTGDTEQPIFTTTECDILANRIVYLLSCWTANQLGPAIIGVGGLAYGGYNIAWGWYTMNVNSDPYDDYYAEAFYHSTNKFAIALIQGTTVAIAEGRCLAEYNRWIEIWETERADNIYAAEVIKVLINDRDGLTVLGDLLATIILPGALVVDIEPPINVHKGETFIFQGRLFESKTTNPLPNKTVELRQIGIEEPLATIITDDAGTWAFNVSLDNKGTHCIYVVFIGDAEYAGISSPLFWVGVGVVMMEVIKSPKSSLNIGEITSFSGVLTDKKTGIGIPGKTINLCGAVSDITITNSDGSWNFDIAFNIEGRYKVYAEFPGDTDFIESLTDEYRISAGLPPMFGYDKKGSSLVKPVSRIIGSVFRVHEDGLAQNIVVYLQYIGAIDARAKCAIYKYEDLSLVAVTDEKEFPAEDGKFIDWVSFLFQTKPSLTAGEYILVGWASEAIAMYSAKTGDLGQGMEQSYMDYNDYPDKLYPQVWLDARYSIYCEYSMKEVTEMLVTFEGTVSAQAVSGELVTITVILPDTTTEQVTTETLADKSFSVEYTTPTPGSYKAKARIKEDALYQAAESKEIPFVIGKAPRTITLTVS